MNYELAKRLKEAGFPQKDHYDENDNLIQFHQNQEFVSIPSLSELIEACRNKFKSLWKGSDDNEWIVNCDYLGYGGIKSKTPEESVAELWLKSKKNEF